MKDIARTTKGDAARGDLVIEREVAWHHVGDVHDRWRTPGLGSASPTAPMHVDYDSRLAALTDSRAPARQARSK
jgi:hypothetical protein